MRIAGALLVLAGLGGCHEPVRDPFYSRCSAIGSSGWRARLVEGERPRLVVDGAVTVPTGGYRVALEPGPVQALAPPVQQVILRTRPRSGAATQALTSYAVRVALKPEEGVERVAVRCGDGIIALIDSIEREPAG
jgi:hypothetical protein